MSSWDEGKWEAGREPTPSWEQMFLVLSALREWEVDKRMTFPDRQGLAHFLAERLLLDD